MYEFCTFFDKNYLIRGLALYVSLQAFCSEFRLWMLCMDKESYRILSGLNLKKAELISLEEFEQNDKALLEAKQNRSPIEYYFTCTPSIPLFIFDRGPDIDLITYLDADIFFFADPAAIFDEIGGASIGIIGHRFLDEAKYLEKYGTYNVGWLTFRRDKEGLACLRRWREQCLEWCYDRVEDGRFADQKYLDDWPEKFNKVVAIQNKGANLAPWNLMRYKYSFSDGNLRVDDERIIFYHFHAVRQIMGRVFDPGLRDLPRDVDALIKCRLYAIYLDILCALTREVEQVSKKRLFSLTGRRGLDDSGTAVARPEMPRAVFRFMLNQLRTIKKRLSLLRAILTGKYMPVWSCNRKYPYDMPL